MTYNADVQWDDLVKSASLRGKQIMAALREAKDARAEWNSFRDGRSDATLATYFDTGGGGRPGTVEADVADLKQTFQSFGDTHDFCDNVASPVQGDRFSDWRKFS